MSHINQKNVVITGGSNGIGFATAELFASQGANVLLTGSSQASVDDALSRSSETLQGVVCDLSDLSEIDGLAEHAKKALGHVDIFFANAGTADFVPLEEVTEAMFDRIMDVNVKGLFFSIQKIVPLMKDGGVIVVTGSIAPRKGQPGVATYAGSKGAVRAIVRNLAPELMDKGIRINCLAPGPVVTNIFNRIAKGDEQKHTELLRKMASTVPLQRMGTPEEIAIAVDFMCGPGAAYMIGSELTLDGGKAEL